MKPWRPVIAIVGIFLLPTILLATNTASEKGPHWEIKGDLSEACSCDVPCPCNFDSRPSHPFCWTMYALGIQKGHYGKVKLNGLHLVAAHADKAVVWYIDQNAAPEQATALRAIAKDLHYGGGRLPQFFEIAQITQEVNDKGNHVAVAGHGGFKADYLMGLDPQKPIVVENNSVWNIPRSIKGRTEYLQYSDTHGNKIDFKKTNSNEGKFDWTDRTPKYF